MPVPAEQLLISHIPVWILKLIWPMKEDIRHRDRELKVLCLGLGRTGTDSLRNALIELGYNDVAHGWYFMTAENILTGIQLERLNRARFGPHPDPSYLASPREFDKVFGPCMAITDAPAAKYAHQLIHVYPNAKIILNRRSDLDAWYRSQLNTIDQINADWWSRIRQFFDPELFWIGRMLYFAKKETNFNFAVEGKGHYLRHYAGLEEVLKKKGREWLDWEVQDGWGPLCRFLREEVPEREFPNENAGGGFAKRRDEVQGDRIVRAERRMKVAAGVGVSLVVAGLGWWLLS